MSFFVYLISLHPYLTLFETFIWIMDSDIRYFRLRLHNYIIPVIMSIEILPTQDIRQVNLGICPGYQLKGIPDTYGWKNSFHCSLRLFIWLCMHPKNMCVVHLMSLPGKYSIAWNAGEMIANFCAHYIHIGGKKKYKFRSGQTRWYGRNFRKCRINTIRPSTPLKDYCE